MAKQRSIVARFFTAIWKVWFLLNFVFIFLLTFPFMFVFLQQRKTYPIVFFFKRICSTWICLSSGIIWKIDWQIPKHEIPKRCVIIANHSSYLDIVISYVFLPHYYVFMAKAELTKVPLFNLLFKDMNIAVDRKSKTDGSRALIKAAEVLQAGKSMYIFPEGTIAKEGVIKPFKGGAFKLAIENEVPILPVTYGNNWRLLQNGGFLKSFGNPGIARITVHPLVQTKGLNKEADLDDLSLRMHHLIQTTYNNYTKKWSHGSNE